ncbi:MAG: laccase domain-containing protein, partial [Actinomycetota bacterium]
MSHFTSEWRAAGGLRWLRWGGAGVEAAFPTREGGLSAGPYATLNLGLAVEDDPAAVLENRRRLGAAIGLDVGRWVVSSQVHGTHLVEVGEAQAGRGARDLTSTIVETDA